MVQIESRIEADIEAYVAARRELLALWAAKQAAMEKGGNKSTFQIRGDPDNLRMAAGAETAQAASPAT